MRRPLAPLDFESATRSCVRKPREKWIECGGGVLPKDVSEVTFGGVGMAPGVLIEAKSEQSHSGDVSYSSNP